MAEAQAQNKLGELFVDLGVGGLGKTLKALNSVSASFLLTKNAAQQAITPFVQMSKESAAFATALDKIRAVTGLTGVQLESLKILETTKKVEGLTDALKNLQQKIINAKTGRDQSAAAGFALLKLNPRELSEMNPVEAFDIIRNRLKDLPETTRTMALNLIQLPEELGYAFDRIDGSLAKELEKIKEEYNINEKNLDNLRRQQDLWNQIQADTAKIQRNIAGMEFNEKFLKEVANILHFTATTGKIIDEEKTAKNQAERRAKAKELINGWWNIYWGMGSTRKTSDDEQIKLKRIGDNSQPLNQAEFQKNVEKYKKQAKLDAQAEAYAEQVYQEEKAKYEERKAKELQDLKDQINKHEANKSIASAVGASVLEGGEAVDVPVPNVAPSAINNTSNSKQVTINNYWNNNFDMLASDAKGQSSEFVDLMKPQIEFTVISEQDVK